MDKPIPPQGYPGGEPHEWAKPDAEAIAIYERELFAYNLALARGEVGEAVDEIDESPTPVRDTIPWNGG